MLNATRIDPGVSKSSIAGSQTIVTQQREAWLAIGNLFAVQQRDTGITNMYRETSHSVQPLLLSIRFHMSDQLVVDIILSVENQSFLQEL